MIQGLCNYTEGYRVLYSYNTVHYNTTHVTYNMLVGVTQDVKTQHNMTQDSVAERYIQQYTYTCIYIYIHTCI